MNGFTKYNIHHNNGELLNHANPKIASEKWHDFWMINFEDNRCLAWIHSFFQKGFSGVPQNMLVEDKGKTIWEIDDNSFDDNETHSR